MAQPTVDAAIFLTPDAASSTYGGPWALRIVAQGSGFVARSMPLTAVVGNVPVLAVYLLPQGTGFAGYLQTPPPEGAVLSVGFEQVLPTDVVYHAANVA